MPALSLRLPEDLDHRLEDEARLEQLPRSEVVRIAIVDYLARRERERFMAELVAEANTAYADESIRRAALEMAEAGMSASNEGLDVVEGHKSGGSRSTRQTEKWWK
ncbi:MAG: CopG domain protein DNA-binding domain protein [Deltaproteobacteria bacterium]|nr:CopG domain protein DNA-binding domain protein [Deltaproteobacteria bacterium]